MPRGQPDYGMYQVKEVGATLADMADLAVRLGSIVEYDRRGDVIFLDDYESPVPKFYKATVAAHSAELNSDYARSGAQCLRFLTDGGAADTAAARYWIAPLIKGKHGIKISLSFVDMYTHRSRYHIFTHIEDGSYWYYIGIRIIPKDRTIEYINSAGNWEIFETSFIFATQHAEEFHNIKFVFDLDNGIYQRLLIDTLTWDLSSLSCKKVESVATPFNQVTFEFKDLVGHVFNIYQDDFVYTINEP